MALRDEPHIFGAQRGFLQTYQKLLRCLRSAHELLRKTIAHNAPFINLVDQDITDTLALICSRINPLIYGNVCALLARHSLTVRPPHCRISKHVPANYDAKKSTAARRNATFGKPSHKSLHSYSGLEVIEKIGDPWQVIRRYLLFLVK